MLSESEPNYAKNQKIAITLFAVSALVFASFAFFQARADDNSVIIQEVTLEQPEAIPGSTSEVEAARLEVSTQLTEENAKEATVANTSGTIIEAGDSDFGPMLFDDKKQAIYIFELEDSSTAECYGNCAKAWPPVLTDGAPVASKGVNGALLGTTQRTDGTTQVTYNGHPLYYYADEKPGEVKCHNIRTHGGLWWVIQPNGNRAS